MHNADNSGATERVRNLLGFTGFLVVQTFYSQVTIYTKEGAYGYTCKIIRKNIFIFRKPDFKRKIS